MLKKLLKKDTYIYLFSMVRSYHKQLYYLLAARYQPLFANLVTHFVQSPTDVERFEKMLASSTFRASHHICVVETWHDATTLLASYKHHPQVTIVKRQTFAYWRALATSARIVTALPLPLYFTKRDGQRVIYVCEAGRFNPSQTRDFLLADRMLADASIATELHPFFQQKVISSLEDIARPLPEAASKNNYHFFIYADTLKLNGITSSLLNLLEALVNEQHTVTFVTQRCQPVDPKPFLERLPKAILLLQREPSTCYTPLDGLKRILFKLFGMSSRIGRWAFSQRWWQEEARRYVGDTRFTAAIEFAGYNVDGARLTLATSAGRKLIWAHADVMSEYKLKHPRLNILFSLYPMFDAFVSCSEALREVNRAALNCSGVTFEACKNLVHPHRVQEGLAASTTRVEDGRTILLTTATKGGEEKRICLDLSLPNGEPQRPEHRFLMVGRLSPEKNYEATIQAFARYVSKGHAAKLFIVGEGPLESKLRALIESLQMTHHIELVGRMYNPAELMKVCDCFLLTSLHEGQPMVVNEARIAQLPIILSRFGAHLDVVVPDGQILVGMDEASILEGFEAFAAGQAKPYTYNPNQYNQSVLKTFYQLCTERSM